MVPPTRILLAAAFLALVVPAALPVGAALPVPLGGLVPTPLPLLGNPFSQQPCEMLCPDMTVDANSMNPYFQNINYGVNDCAVREGMTPPGPQRIVRFTSYLANIGQGDLVIGAPSANNPNFEFSPCHGHYHTKDYAAYRVWTEDAYAAYKDLRMNNPFVPADDLIDMLPADLKPVAGRKQGFCVYDLAQYTGDRIANLLNDGRRFTGCGFMGISNGWADVYSSGILGQWVVITGVPPGQYLLDIEVNANHHYQELNYWNNSVTRAITIT